MKIWQRDLNCEICKDTWSQILAQNCSFVKDARGKFFQYKVLHRYYWTHVDILTAHKKIIPVGSVQKRWELFCMSYGNALVLSHFGTVC